MGHRNMADTLRTVADLLDQHPDLPAPYVTAYDHQPDTAGLHWYLHINDKGDATAQREAVQRIIRTLGGKWDKATDGINGAEFTQNRDGLDLEVVVIREAVCTRRVVGTETVTIPAVEAQPARTEERDVVEWDCAPLMADQAAS